MTSNIRLTDGQQAALGALVGPRHRLALAGVAGAGKTTVLAAAMPHWIAQHRQVWREVGDRVEAVPSICIAAFTHRALSVVRQNLAVDTGGRVHFATMASLRGERREYDEDKEEVVTVRDPNSELAKQFSLIVVDEASMLTHDAIKFLFDLSARVILVGDPAQLPPVRSDDVVFDKVCHTHWLDGVQRQAAGNPVLDAATWVRERRWGEINLAAVPWDREHLGIERGLDDAMGAVGRSYHRDTYTPVLVYTHKARALYNKAIHDKRHPGSPLFGPGEPVVAMETVYVGDTPVLPNGEVTACVSCTAGEVMAGVQTYTVELTDGLELMAADEHVLKARIDELRAISKQYVAKKKQLEAKLPELDRRHGHSGLAIMFGGKGGNAPLTEEQQQAQHEMRRLEAEHTLVQADLKLLQTMLAPLALGYAITVHKAQGSTFNGVCIDWSSICTGGRASDATRKRMFYTALTRPRRWAVLLKNTPR